MIRHLTVAAAALSLAACTSIGTPSPSTQLAATKAFLTAEQGYDTVVVLADGAINTGALTPVTVRMIKDAVDQGHAYVVAGRSAVKAADSATLMSETAAMTALAGEISALIPKGH